MGMRFRKSVKISKGVKVNFSKSGASLSFGGRGHSVNVSSRGTRTTIGIPGTGVSYSTTRTNHNKSRTSSYRGGSRELRSSSGGLDLRQFRLQMKSDGKVEIQDDRGMTITDQSTIRKIKATDAYKNTVLNLEVERQKKLEEFYNEAKSENDIFVNINKLSPQVHSKEHYLKTLEALRPQVYIRKKYEVPCPTEEIVRELLTQEANEIVVGNLFKIGKLRREYVESNIQSRLSDIVYNWTREKEMFEARELENEKIETARYNAEYNANKRFMNALINGEDYTVSEAVESWISSCELPVEIKVDYEWHQYSHTMYLDVDLPEIEDLPENEVIRLASGNLKEKKKTQTTLKQEYVNLVFGLAIFISANIYNVSPAIHNIVISGYTQRKDKSGAENDEYVYSIKFTRKAFENSILSNVDPRLFCMRFENRSNVTSSMLMKKIEPY